MHWGQGDGCSACRALRLSKHGQCAKMIPTGHQMVLGVLVQGWCQVIMDALLGV